MWRGCPPLDVFVVLERARVLVWARVRRGSFFSGSGALSAKRLDALIKLVVAGATGAMRGRVQWVFFPDFFVKLAG